jgi:hypothetical protein
MTTTSVMISVSHAHSELGPSAAADPVREVARLLHAYAASSDVTLSIELARDHGTLLVALETGSAFIGLVTQDGIYQYVADNVAEGKGQFIIGGQLTAIDNRYVLPIAAVIGLLTPWLAGSAPLAASEWERM